MKPDKSQLAKVMSKLGQSSQRKLKRKIGKKAYSEEMSRRAKIGVEKRARKSTPVDNSQKMA